MKTMYSIIGTIDGKYWFGPKAVGTHSEDIGDFIFQGDTLCLDDISCLNRLLVEPEFYVSGIMFKKSKDCPREDIFILRENVIFYYNKMISDSFIIRLKDGYNAGDGSGDC